MIIQYEPGDIVTVDDDVHAGEAAACEVELLYQKLDGTWVVTIQDSDFTGAVEVYEQFLNP